MSIGRGQGCSYNTQDGGCPVRNASSAEAEKRQAEELKSWCTESTDLPSPPTDGAGGRLAVAGPEAEPRLHIPGQGALRSITPELPQLH